MQDKPYLYKELFPFQIPTNGLFPFFYVIPLLKKRQTLGKVNLEPRAEDEMYNCPRTK